MKEVWVRVKNCLTPKLMLLAATGHCLKETPLRLTLSIWALLDPIDEARHGVLVKSPRPQLAWLFLCPQRLALSHPPRLQVQTWAPTLPWDTCRARVRCGQTQIFVCVFPKYDSWHPDQISCRIYIGRIWT